ncbi:MAG: hypothetical protein A2X36_13620 [Elusimicrobia bacterium GWA2_69_24]|nr:MAG: hypothetical protein A2X36_13620 [Elusimicrobia bacterium GWA2_69_24]HBL19022.1 hypothetical protein [Elusimicrobiota bacterium]
MDAQPRTLAFLLGLLAAASLPAGAASYDSLAARLGKDAAKAGISRVAVLPFSAMDGSDEAEGVHIAEQLATRLVRGGRVSVVERVMLPAVMSEHRLGATGAFDPDTLSRLGGLAQAEAVVVGSFVTLGDAVELNLRLVRIDSGVALAARSARLHRDWFPAAGGVIPAPALFSADEAVADVYAAQNGRAYRPRRSTPVSLASARASGGGEFFQARSWADGDLRDSVAEQCTGVGERVDSLQESILELKARYWARRLRKPGFSSKSVPLKPGDLISDSALRSRFYELLQDETEAPGRPLSLSEIKRFISVDRRSFELLAACRR